MTENVKRSRSQCNLQEAQEFLEILGAKNCTFQTFADGKGKGKGLASIVHGSFDEHADELARLNRLGAGVFVSVNATDLKGRKKANIERVRAVTLDLDGAPLDPLLECKLKPHVIIETSPDRYHACWRVKGLSCDQFEDIQRAIAKRFDGDPDVAKLTHLERLPGFYHRKAEPFLCYIVEVNDLASYTADEIISEFPPEEKPHKASISKGTKQKKAKEDKQAVVLLQIADEVQQQQEALFHNADGTAYADLNINGHRETWPVRSKTFRNWLSQQFYERTKTAPSSEAMSSALNLIEARAVFDGPECEVFLRIAPYRANKCYYLDLCNREWQAIEIDTDGWRVVDNPPVRFIRRKGMLPLPIPVTGGSIETLRSYVNVKDDDDFCLVTAWLLASLRERGPYPVLVLIGRPGAAKSTTMKVLRSLIDPNTAVSRAPPREDRDCFIAATNSLVPSFDNLSYLPDWLSDTLARLATEGGFATRQLYTDDEERIFNAMRPILLGGIENVVIRGDLAERSIFIVLPEIGEDKRRREHEFWPAFNKDRPAILGALLDVVVHGLRTLPYVHLERLPRMADFVEWWSARHSI